MTHFNELGLAAPILQALEAEGYSSPTPIQAKAIPHVIAGRDLLGIAQTGTGKTAAFALPILNRLAADKRRPERNSCRVLVLSPTRELASQIGESFRAYGRNLRLSTAVVFGGVGHRPQEEALARGVDILVATPGRLIDHLSSRVLRLDKVEVFVLDEADQMLDMGFIHAIRKIVPMLPKARQSLFFSATMPREIGALAGELLTNPEQVAVTPVATTAERVAQKVIFIETARKRSLLAEILSDDAMARTIVFTRTKHGADRVVRHLEDAGISAAAIHGNKSQSQRERALDGFKSGSTPILVATDIAARGIDVDGVTHVVNFDLPNIPESYVHRIGRTARAGASGSAISFCDHEERAYLKAIERLIKASIPAIDRRDPNAPKDAPVKDAAGDRDARGPRGRSSQGRPQQGKPQQREARPAQERSGRNGQRTPESHPHEKGAPGKGAHAGAQGRSQQGSGQGSGRRQERREHSQDGHHHLGHHHPGQHHAAEAGHRERAPQGRRDGAHRDQGHRDQGTSSGGEISGVSFMRAPRPGRRTA